MAGPLELTDTHPGLRHRRYRGHRVVRSAEVDERPMRVLLLVCVPHGWHRVTQRVDGPQPTQVAP